MRRFSLSTGLVLLVLLSLWPASCRDRDVPRGKRAEIGQPAPVFQLQDLAGDQWRLADLQGRVVLLYFWAPRCQTCRQELAHLEEVQRQLAVGSRDLRLLTVVDGEDMELTRSLVKQLDLSFPILRDPGAETAGRYDVAITPTTFLIDRHGVLRQRFVGHQHWDVAKVKRVIRPYSS